MARHSLSTIAATTTGRSRSLNWLPTLGLGEGYRWATAVALIGAAGAVAAAATTPQRLWLNVLAGGQFLLGLGLGAGFLVALLFATGASWGVALRRVPEAMTRLLVPGAVATLAVVFLRPSTWPWVGAAPTGHPGLWFRDAWLSLPFFQIRSVGYLVLWLGLSAWLLRPSFRQDDDGRVEHTFSSRRRAAVYLLVFGLTVWLASTDWLMSLDPEWYSTVFGVYQFAGIFLSAIAAVTLAVVHLSEDEPLKGAVTDEHLHDLGKLMFAFSTFWMYIWFCQFMLVWYANIPEETVYFIPRVSPWWLPLFLLNVAVNWAIPFLVLLPREAKRRRAVLTTVSLTLLAGRWLDLYLQVEPRVLGPRPGLGLGELAPLLLAGGVSVLVFQKAFRARPPIPARDPLLKESLTYHA